AGEKLTRDRPFERRQIDVTDGPAVVAEMEFRRHRTLKSLRGGLRVGGGTGKTRGGDQEEARRGAALHSGAQGGCHVGFQHGVYGTAQVKLLTSRVLPLPFQRGSSGYGQIGRFISILCMLAFVREATNCLGAMPCSTQRSSAVSGPCSASRPGGRGPGPG